jgi:cytochrome c oxidase assembly protein subunit 15
VGFVAIAFVALLWRREPRPWVRKLGYLAFAGVVAQGVLGGVRVLVVSDEGDALRSAMDVETAAGAQSLRYLFAMVHAGLAYLLFALMVCLVWLTSRHWRDGDPRDGVVAGSRRIRRGCVAAAAVVFAQLLAGAYLRHALLWTTAKVVLHVTGALFVGLAAAWLAFEVFRARGRFEVLERPALYVLVLAQLQIFLGILAFVAGTGSHARDFSYGWTAVLQTGHQVVGPLLFAGSALLVLKAYRNLKIAA